MRGLKVREFQSPMEETEGREDKNSGDLGYLLLQETKTGNVNQVVDLICKGATFSCDWLGTSPLHWAAYNNSSEVTELLLNGGVLRDAKNKVDRTPLHIAAQGGYVDIVKLLMSYGANPNSLDMLNMSPLHWAVENGSEECVRLLMEYGAVTNIVDKFGRAPLDIAKTKNFQAIIQLFYDKPEIVKVFTEEERNSSLQELLLLNKIKLKSERSYKGMEKSQGACVTPNFLLGKPAPVQASFSNQEVNKSNLKVEETLEMLKEHGIQMLEPDKRSVVTSAVQSGQKVVLTEAGKLALNSLERNRTKNISSNPDKIQPKIVINGKKMVKIDANKLKLFNVQKDKIFLKPSKSIEPPRMFEGKLYDESEDEDLIKKLKNKIAHLRSQGIVLDAFAKKKFREANVYQQQLLCLLKLKGRPLT